MIIPWDGLCFIINNAVGLLKEGWNPVYMLSNDFNNAEISIRNAKEGRCYGRNHIQKLHGIMQL